MIKKSLILFTWVLHVTALIGIALGYQDFFVTKSPFTLLYLALVLWICYPIQSIKKSKPICIMLYRRNDSRMVRCTYGQPFW